MALGIDATPQPLGDLSFENVLSALQDVSIGLITGIQAKLDLTVDLCRDSMVRCQYQLQYISFF